MARSSSMNDGDLPNLKLDGRLELSRVAAVLASAPERIGCIDLEAVEHIDTAGVALIAQLVTRSQQAGGPRPTVRGQPEGLEALCSAYRINVDFSDFP